MLPRRPYPVKLIATHYEPHEDELNNREQALCFGEQAFPGIRTADVILMDAGLHPETGRDGDYYLMTQQTLCDGICGGEFDEHGKKGKIQSAAARMAAWLGRQDDPGLKPFLEFSLRADRHAGNGPFELPNLIKSWHNDNLRLAAVISMYHTIFRSLYRKFSGAKPVARPVPGAFRKLLAEWFVERFTPQATHGTIFTKLKTGEEAAYLLQRNGDDVQPIISLDQREEDAEHGDKNVVGLKTDFDLEGIYEAMVCAGIPYDECRRIVFVSLNTKYKEQLDFLAACRDFKNDAAYLDAKRSVYRIAIITSDSRQMNRAARWLDNDVDVLIQRIPDGHVRIFDLRKRLNMNPVAAQLRMAEWHKRNKTQRLRMSALLSEGTLPYIRQWYNWQEGHGVFCGTNTAPRMACTWLTLDEVVGCVAKGLYQTHLDHHTQPQREFRQWLKRRREQRKDGALVDNLVGAVTANLATIDTPRLAACS